MKSRKPTADLRGAAKLAVAATTGITDVVEEMHQKIASSTYASIRGVTSLIGGGLDRVLAQIEPFLGANIAESNGLVSALNGVVGDYLEETKNPLAIPMDLPVPEVVTGKLLVLVHGSSMNDRQWNRAGHDHGAALARDLGYTPVYVRYNSGLHVSTNGRTLAAKLEELVSAWPVAIEELTLIGHSMGGLLARSACHAGAEHAWRKKLRRLVCLGTPHHGSPLERGGNIVDTLLGVSSYSAPLARLGKIRSAGVTDLRYGNVLDEDWADRPRFALGEDQRRGLPLPAGVDCYAVAGAMGEKLATDGLVPVDSALGRNAAERTLAFPEEHQWIAVGTKHLDLLSSVEVYEKVRGWLAEKK